MKKRTLALILLCLATTCYSQTPVAPTSTQEPVKGTKEYYLQKRKANMVRGWILTPTGVVLLGVGYVMALSELVNGITSYGQDEPNGTSAGLIAVAGVVSIVGGTISFVSAGHNKRKAKNLTVGFEPILLLQQGSLMTKAVPTVGLKIAF